MLFNPTLMPTQPAVKLATANLELMLRFSSSPEVLSHTLSATSQMVQQAGAHTLQLMQTDAFEVMVKNPSFRALASDPGFQALAMNPQAMAAMAHG